VNNGPQRNLVTLIASSFFAGMIIGTASAHPPRETVNDKKPTLEAKTKTSKGVLEDTDPIWPTTPIPKVCPTRNQRILFSIR